jgi:uncharacterized repeat protein (TIGR01451 family)
LSTAACTAAGYTSANCNSGLAFLYGDTGIFYSTRSDTAMFASGSNIITLTNGYQTDPTNNAPWGSVGGTGNERVHNKWDAVQTNAFGANSVISNSFSALDETRLNTAGRGSTPYYAGSPVAGQDSGQPWDRYGVNGPWNRISYPGSCMAATPSNLPANNIGSVSPTTPSVGTVNSVSACVSTGAGTTVNDTAPLSTSVNAIRFALGGITSGQTKYVKVRLKVINAALITGFNIEGHGSDSTQQGTTIAGNDNPWRYWIGAPTVLAAGSARLYVDKQIVSVNGGAYNGANIPPGATVRYRITYANAYGAAQTNVQLSDILPTQSVSTASFTILSGPNITPSPLPSSGTFNFQPIATLGIGAGGSLEFDVTTNAATGATVTNTARINSTQLPTLQTDAVSTSVTTAQPSLAMTKTPTPVSVSAAGQTVSYAIAVNNNGNIPVTAITVSDPLGTVICPTSGNATIASLVVGVTETCALSYSVPQAVFDNNGGGDSDIDNTASATGTSTAGSVSQSASAVVALTGAAQLSISKTYSFEPGGDVNGNGVADYGDVITYRYSVTNNGNRTLTGVNVLDTHAGYGVDPVASQEQILTDVSPTGDSTDAAQNNSWDSLAPGDTVRFAATYSVVQQDIDNLQ